jgi:hypothetical protein
MKLDRIAVNDVVEVRVRGRLILGRITEIKAAPSTSTRSARAPVGGTPKRARSSPNGARQEDSGPAREKPNPSRQLRSTGSSRSRNGQVEEPTRTDPRHRAPWIR